VSNSAGHSSLFAQTFKTFRLAPWHFLLLQFPEAAADLLERLSPGRAEEHLALKIILLFPSFCIASTLASSLTFASVLDLSKNVPLSIGSSLRSVGEKWKTLIPTSVLLGIIILLGFLALILPGLYFMAAFLFVPQLIVTEPKLPWSVYFFKSKKLAKKAFLKTFFAVTIFFIANVAGYFIGELGEGAVASLTGNTGVQVGLSVCLGIVLSVFTGAFVNLWISYFFLTLTEKNTP
jgi:hypothetical protein